eukprot:TRINITY_DN3673_c0_g1_i2.p1 TRINITY_DN3673_c0_g1~~TRINITY_DN3673_c0_g1_i2.p1  ORF type:complete len:188 (-),score=31.26 TRINITY_DN3673_c0_g1_i2:435-998(-)
MNRGDSLQKRGSIADFACSLSPKDVKLMHELFDMCDADGDGEVTCVELGKVMDDLNITHTPQDLENLFEQLDADDNGTVSFDEFLKGIRFMQKSNRLDSLVRSKGLTRENSVVSFVERLSDDQLSQMKQLFEMIDTNQDGVITKRELGQVMVEMGLSPTREVTAFFFISYLFSLQNCSKPIGSNRIV